MFELAVDQEELDMPEMLWKAFIDFEISQQEFERARALYERLLERSNHVKVWISYGKFEFENANLRSIELEISGVEAARSVLSRG